MHSRNSRTPVASLSAFLVCTLVVCVLRMSAQNTISTIAGGASVAGPATGPNANIPGPSSVGTDSQRNLYIASPAANQIMKVDTLGNLTVFAGRGWPVESPKKYDGNPATQSYLNNPTGVAVDPVGNVYIADTDAYLIRQVNTSGVMSTPAGTGDFCSPSTANCGDSGPAQGALLGAPTAVTTDSQGNIYFADTGINRIRVVNMQSSNIVVAGVTIKPGAIATVAGNGNVCPSPTNACGDGGKAKIAQLNSPQGIAVDTAGNIYIADSGDRRVRAVNTKGYIGPWAGTGAACFGGACGDGGPATSAQLGNPWQLYMDASGNLYVSDSLSQRVRKVIPGKTPTISTFAGSGGSCSSANMPPITAAFCGDGGAATTAFLDSPRGVFGDSAGNIYIGDSGDQRVRQVASGNINTYAGGGSGNDGGPATGAILAASRDIVVDGSGNLYIADTGDNRIRKVSGGTITTVAGNGVANYYGNNNALAVNANLSGPYGLAVDGSGNIYIADTNNLVIRVVNVQSSQITVAGVVIQPGEIANIAGKPGVACTSNNLPCGDGGPARSAMLGFPTKVALDGAGNIFIADAGSAAVRMINSSGTISTVAGQLLQTCQNPTNFAACGDGGSATLAMLNQPFSIAVDSAENVYVSDAGDNRVRVFTVGGNINAYAMNGLTTFGPDGQPALSNSYIDPLYITLDSRDNLFFGGSSLYYVVQRVDSSTNPALLNPVASVAGWPVSPKYYGYCDSNCSSNNGNLAVGAFLNNYGLAVDSAENLYIADGGNNRVRLVSSSATQGLTPVAKVTPATLNFPATPIGVQSSPLNFSVSNTGSDDLVMGTGSTTGPFQLTSQTPCYGNAVPPSTSCAFSVTFTPTGYGPETGTAVVNDNSFTGATQTVTLKGSGPDFAESANPNTLTIARGNKGTSTITLTPSAGFNQSVSMSCTGLPAGSSCSFSPNPVAMNGSVQTTIVTITVGTTTKTGTYTVGIKGSSVTTHSTGISLTVQ